ncbi:MAG: hypothetical protein O7G83_06335 [Proteobacteria bacterium]|nr:hypothetical protein [Pseudomonadota bacterium]
MHTRICRFIIASVTLLILAGCQSASEHAADVAAANPTGSNLTVGTVQREIREGMSGAEVAAALGSPNIVTTDEKRREVWIYDKISSTKVFSTDSGGVGILFITGYQAQSGASSTTQKTLTIIIKFDENKRVRDFAYHSSTF